MLSIDGTSNAISEQITNAVSIVFAKQFPPFGRCFGRDVSRHYLNPAHSDL